MTKSALVIGAGIAGPTVAMALQKAGIDATIYEAYGTVPERIGGGFNIATNGQDALAAIDALAATEGLGIPADRYSMYNASGRLIGTVATGLARPDGTTTQTFRRADLFSALSAEATRRGIRTEYGKRLVGFEESPTSVTAAFGDDTSATADILIGADGIRSTARQLLDPSAPAPHYLGICAFGGFAPNPGLRPDPGTWKMTFGSRAFFGYFIPDQDQVVWFVNMPSKEPLAREQILAEGLDRWAEKLIDLFDGETVPAEPIIHAQGHDIVVVGAEYDLPKVPRWHDGRVVLVGDAAHAMSTSSGQGASMAMESAVTLGRCLRDCAEPQDAFAAYERLRRRRVDQILRRGAKTANSKAVSGFAAFMRDTFMGIGLKYFYKPEKDAWLFQHHIDWDAPVSEELANAA